MRTTKLQFVEEKDESVRERKDNLRRFMKARRADNANRDVKELLMCDNVFAAINSDLTGAGTRLNFFVYLSYSSEAKTDKLIERLKKQGHFVYAPRIENKEMVPVLLEEDFTLSRYGIREPVGEVFDGRIDVIVAPLLAVDKHGNRLGYGGGYYDAFFRKYPGAKRMAFCYDFQILQDVPNEACDEKIDVIVTDKQIVYVKN